MNNSDSRNDKGSTIIYKYECLDCENYKRKVIETEQTISGRDVLIEMLQQEIKKMEERYKTSIDDYEKLRFKYCTVVQDLGNLKEIHKKLEKSNSKLIKDREIARNHLEILQKEIENSQKQSKVPLIQSIPSEGDGQIKKNIKDSESLNQNILKEVMNMEVIMQNQNETVKEVLLKVLNEMKGAKGSKQIEEEFQKTSAYSTASANIKVQSKEQLLSVIENLNTQIDELNVTVESLKLKNEAIVKELTEKKTNLAQCLNVLEDNHSNLNNLSGNIDMIINEKEKYLNEMMQLKKTLEENEKKLQSKEEEISELKSKISEKSESLEVDTMRKINQDLQKALNECQNDLEKLQDEYLEKEKQCTIEKCQQLAKALVEAKSTGDRLNIIDTKPKESQTEKIQEAPKKTDSKSTDAVDKHQHMMEINLLKDQITSLESDLKQTKLENTEYEEENKCYSQKLENLALQLQELQREKVELQNTQSKSFNIPELKEKYEMLATQKDNEIKQLKSEINELKKNDQGGDLKTELANLHNEMEVAQVKDEQLILQLQEKIDTLEKVQIQKQLEIDQCCSVVQNIKEALAEKNLIDENNLCQIKVLQDRNSALEAEKQQLQKTIDDLKNQIADYEYKFKDCDCKYGKQVLEKGNLESFNTKLQDNVKQLEIELCKRECLNEKLHKDMKEMEIEICRKQCTINHLEQCLDKSNKILAECEKEMKEMHSENESAKNENEALKKDLQNYAMNVQRTSTEKKDLQEKVTKLNRQSQDLEIEKDILSMNLKEKSAIEDELNQLKKMYNTLVKTNKEKDEELNKLKNALDNSKKDYDKILKAYKEVKETLAEEIKKYKIEVEKIIKDKESFHIDLNPSIMELKKLQCLIEEKEEIIRNLEKQKRELTTEVAQLKSYANKIITDNKNLRTAIDNLLTTLVDKLKNFTDNEEEISLKSNEILVKDILNSLLDLERSVMSAGSGTSAEKCNCMSVIMSTYNIDAKDTKSQHLYMPPCKNKCGKKVKDLARYVSSKLTSNEGIASTCEACCSEGQKGIDGVTKIVTPTRSLSDSYAAKPNHSWS